MALRHRVALAAAFSLGTITMGADAADDPLAAHLWRSRILVVVAADARDPALATQRRLYQAAMAGNRERDLVLVEGVGRSAGAEALRRRFGVPAGEFRAVLVGKDGGGKIESGEPIPADRLFAEIDAMPMRRGEMRVRP